MSSLQPFLYGSNEVRTVVVDGEPWFVASDLCRVIEHSNPSKAVAALDDDEKGLTKSSTLGGVQTLTVISEPGMYKLMARSTKASAKPFLRWLTHEVLPSIRKTGSYGIQAIPAPALTGTELLAAAVLEAQAIIAAKDQQIQELAPKAAFHSAFVAADNWWDVRDAAQLLRNEGIQTGQNKLFAWMRANDWLGTNIRPKQAKLNAGLLELKLSDYVIRYNADGQPEFADPKVMDTRKGLNALRKALTAPAKPAALKKGSSPREHGAKLSLEDTLRGVAAKRKRGKLPSATKG